MMKKYFGELYVTQNIIVPLAITMSLLSLSQDATDVDLMLLMSYTVLGWLCMVFIPCYFSQELCDESIRLSEVLGSIPWYQETPKVRKDLLMMMMATREPIVIDYKGIMPMNLHRFGEVVNASYSFFTLLQSVDF